MEELKIVGRPSLVLFSVLMNYFHINWLNRSFKLSEKLENRLVEVMKKKNAILYVDDSGLLMYGEIQQSNNNDDSLVTFKKFKI